MIHSDRVYGKPLVLYQNTKVNIEAMVGLAEGSCAYATDSNEFGTYDGATWTWGSGAGGQYLQFLYEVSGGTFTFLTDIDGNPLMGLQDLE